MERDDDLDEQFQKFRRTDWPGGTMPVGSAGARRRARKKTHKTARKQKQVGRSVSGIRHRRKKGGNDG